MIELKHQFASSNLGLIKIFMKIFRIQRLLLKSLLVLCVIYSILFWHNRSFAGISLGSDLTLLFDCGTINDDRLVSEFESFLSENDYRHLNVSKYRRQAGVNVHRVYIVGLNNNHAIITLVSFLRKDAGYAFTLQTQPPTRRDMEFEDRILKFVDFDIGCSIRQLDRSHNTPESLGFFNQKVRRIEGWFEQADVLRSR